MTKGWKTFWLRWPVTAHLLALLLALTLGTLTSESWRQSQETEFRAYLQGVALRVASDIESTNIRGAHMGMAMVLGLNEPVLKELARGKRPSDDPAALRRLQVVRQLAGVEGVYVIDQNGIVVAHESEDPHVTGADFSFRPFWQVGMLGHASAYPAVGHVSKKRGIYVSAPLFAGDKPEGEVLGVVVVKLSMETLLSQLQREGRDILLVSPQGVVFAATNPAWRFHLVAPLTPGELQHLKMLKTFGPDVESGTAPPLLPFDLTQETLSIQGERFFRARASVQWKDPEGRWYLMVLSKVEEAVPLWQRWLLGGGVALALFALLSMLMRASREVVARQQALAQNVVASHELADAVEQKARQAAIILKLQDARTLPALAETFFQQLSTFAPVHRGALYYLSHDDPTHADAPVLQLAGSYGAQGAVPTMALGEGLTGQCALDRRAMVLHDVPSGFWRVVSGTGEATPRVVMLLPISKQNNLLGVVELASINGELETLQPLVETLIPVLGMNLEVLLAERRTDRLLVQAQAVAQEYRHQQEYSQSMEGWYQSVLYGAPDGILVVDHMGIIVLSNRLAQEMFGYQEAELHGMSVEQLLPAVLRDAHAQWREAFTDDAIQAHQMAMWRSGLRGVRKDGQPLDLSISLASIPATAYRGPCVCAVIRAQ